jgi:hypothetical protein
MPAGNGPTNPPSTANGTCDNSNTGALNMQPATAPVPVDIAPSTNLSSTLNGTRDNSNAGALNVQPATPTMPAGIPSFSDQGPFPSLKPDGFAAIGTFTANNPPHMQSCKWAELKYFRLMLIPLH